MAEPFIKQDPDTKPASPSVFEDEDIYEDAGDLEFNTDPKFQSVYLARVPKYLWEAWAHLDDDAEIHIGTIRQSTEETPDGQKKVGAPALHRITSANCAGSILSLCYFLLISQSIKWSRRSMCWM
jgi:transcription initiation factor TFIIF subunit beta